MVFLASNFVHLEATLSKTFFSRSMVSQLYSDKCNFLQIEKLLTQATAPFTPKIMTLGEERESNV